MEKWQKKPRNTDKRALWGQHKYGGLFKLQRNPTEDLKNVSFQNKTWSTPRFINSSYTVTEQNTFSVFICFYLLLPVY
jgi:hypothetical protein